MSVSSYAQNISGSFDYEDCGCGGVVDLQIHNGLYGQFGGDRVPDADEYSLGAITVANLNDTDGDTIVDNIDTVVTGQSNNYRANGQIIIDSLSMVDTSVVDAYELIPRPSPTGDVFWTLKFARVPFMYDSIAVSNTSSVGPWLIQSNNLRVLIKRGGGIVFQIIFP